MTIAAKTLCVRALNYWRPYHLETYLGIRYVAESSTVHADGKWLNLAIGRKRQSRTNIRSLIFPRFKGWNKTGGSDIREFSASSPISALIETDILEELRTAPRFNNRNHIYSYRWPRANSPRIFEHYMKGYAQRNREITERLIGSEDKVVIVADIQRFYPNIDRTRLAEQIRAMKRADLGESKSSIREHLELFLTAPSDSGLPIAPPTSHILANLALEDVDAHFCAKYPNHYFRYVDDIIVITDEDNAKAVLAELAEKVSVAGFKLNEDKTDVISSSAWITHCPQFEYTTDSFEDLLTRTTLACALKPDTIGEFGKVCDDEGVLLPINRVRDRSTSGRVRRWFHVLMANGLIDTTTAETFGPKDFQHNIRRLRARLADQLKDVFSETETFSPMMRRWQLQRKRYLLSRLFYITPTNELPIFLPIVKSDPELSETQALFESVITKDAGPLLHFPGAPVAAFCSVARRLGVIRMTGGKMAVPTSTNIAALSTLITAGVIAYSEDDPINAGKEQDRRLLALASRRLKPRSHFSIDYFDEINALQSGFSSGQSQEFLATRYDLDEDLSLEALLIGGDTNSGTA
ncbi:MAG: RNA-directed DNA polymerase [Elusimicrobia bacterium]|nr:RNA-directed DNA polymerase [Elusimicrobiota bacterium]